MLLSMVVPEHGVAKVVELFNSPVKDTGHYYNKLQLRVELFIIDSLQT